MYRTTTYTRGATCIEITALPGLGREDAVEAAHHRFITTHWPSLGAAAYEGFRHFGIGAVIVHEADAAGTSTGVGRAFVRHQLSYAAGVGTWMRTAFGDAASEALAEELEAYDPREAGLFVFVRADEPPRVYRVESTLRPPQALERARALLN
ncbi:hypothetical protein AWN76_006940 [Rhodothermaceae bacterium RA]|nr:hypothetical protein AWN76_006940 [Rhodothermaceae bacterium RA]